MFLVEAKTETWLLKIIGYGGHSPQEGVFLSFKTHKIFLSHYTSKHIHFGYENYLIQVQPTKQNPEKTNPENPLHIHVCTLLN